VIFISHSSKDNAAAIALRDWLQQEGWNDLFLDLDPERGIMAGERWERALHEAANRCEAVIFLISRAWLASDWCTREYHLADKLNKRMFGVLIADIPVEDVPADMRRDFQLVSLAGGRDHRTFRATMPDGSREEHVTFSESGLTRLRNGLTRAGLGPKFFAWPPQNDPDRPPYRGLRALEAEDAGIFFGREAQTIAALDALRGLREESGARCLVILGASGAGKSSFLRAGLLPRLQRDDAHVLTLPVIRPERAVLSGETGFVRAVEQACAHAGVAVNRAAIKEAMTAEALPQLLTRLIEKSRPPVLPGESPEDMRTLILPVDQAEELFLAEGAEEAQAFLDLIGGLLSDPSLRMLAVFAVRSDAYERLQSAAALEHVRQATFSLPPMPRGAYESVIEGPARRLRDGGGRLEIEPALTQALLTDIEEGGAKDALPLLAFTLERLYADYGGDGDLTLAEYHRSGRVKGSIEAAVARALATADADQRVPRDEGARLALLRRALVPWLAGIDVVSKEPRRRVARFSEIPPEARPLVEHLVAVRLLATDRDEAGTVTVEPAHEALLRQWGLLKGWLEEDFAALATLDGVQRATRDWEANARNEDWLAHTAGRLEDAERLAGSERLGGFLDAAERAYLAACRVKETAERDRELEEARRREEDAVRLAATRKQVLLRTRMGLAAAGLLLVLALGATWFAVDRANDAETQRKEAVAQREHAEQVALQAEQLATVGDILTTAVGGAISDTGQARSEADRQKILFRNMLQASITRNHAAEYIVGQFYYLGLGTNVDYAKAREWWEKAAAAGYAGAMRSLGVSFYYGSGLPGPDYIQARAWYEKAVTAGNNDAMRDLGLLYRDGLGVGQDYAKAREWFEKAAVGGNADAMLNLGELYEKGEGLPGPNYDKAREWYEKAAAAGDIDAMIVLGAFYWDGLGLPGPDYARARAWYEKAAAAGNNDAMLILGMFYKTGWGVPQPDYAEAREWYEKAAAAGNAQAMVELGAFYQNGLGFPAPDYAEAREWFEKAAALGNSDAMVSLGLLHKKGLGLSEPDFVQAREWFEKAAAAGNSDAMVYLGALYQNGSGFSGPDYVQAREWYEKAAAAGNGGAMVDLGALYQTGLGFPAPDYAEARKWFEKAAALGNGEAMNDLGALYQNGFGFSAPDYAKALEWYEEAAAAGNIDAMVSLGWLYERGLGLSEPDYVKAREWYEKAAAAGNDLAMVNLGTLYQNGLGFPAPDYARAREWWGKAAAAGSSRAMFNLGLAYYNSWGIPQDYAKAREWWEKAAAAGSSDAMFSVGLVYYNSWGVPQDYTKAREWWEKAAATGNSDAIVGLGEIYENGFGFAAPEYAKAREWYEKAAAAGNGVGMINLAHLYVQAKGVEQNLGKAEDLLTAARKAGAPSDALVTAFIEVSWYSLLAKQFDRALDTGRQALAIDPSSLTAKTNIAHALMYLGRTEEARAAYLAERGKTVPDQGLWEDVIRKDFAELRKADLSNPLMDEIEAAFAMPPSAR
jgi:TPR repeat protein